MPKSAALNGPASDRLFRQALANLANGVTVIMAYGAAGPPGLAASKFVSVPLFPRHS